MDIFYIEIYSNIFYKLAQITDPSKTSYNQLANINIKSNYLNNQIAKSQYNDQIKSNIKRLADMFGHAATKAFNSGLNAQEGNSIRLDAVNIINLLKTLIHENTLKPFDDLIDAIKIWVPKDINSNAGVKPQGAQNPVNAPSNINQPLSTPSTIAPISPAGIAGI